MHEHWKQLKNGMQRIYDVEGSSDSLTVLVPVGPRRERVTVALLKALRRPWVDISVHLGRPGSLQLMRLLEDCASLAIGNVCFASSELRLRHAMLLASTPTLGMDRLVALLAKQAVRLRAAHSVEPKPTLFDHYI